MLRHPQFFGEYAKQVEAAEVSGQVAQVLDQIVSSIRESSGLKHKIKSAMIYPIIVLSITFGVAWYLFTYTIPDILNMVADLGSGEVPPMTQLVMRITAWMEIYAVPLVLIIVSIILILVFCGKGPFKRLFHRFYTKLPLISKISVATNVCTWMQSLKYMLMAGSPMGESLSAAADSMTNIYMQKQANDAYILFASTGIAVNEALKEFEFLTAMELSTINVGLQSDQIVEVLNRLYLRRKEEAEKSINAFITALNPMIICILGLVVGVIVVAVYGPLMNVTSMIS